jgi:hypothetical protein
MKNSIHTKKLKQKERIVLILTVIILVGLTYVLLKIHILLTLTKIMF